MPWWRRGEGSATLARVGARGRHPSGTRHSDSGWPVVLEACTPSGVAIALRPLTQGDADEFLEVRRANAAWLGRWDATSPAGHASPRTFAELVDLYDADARAGRALAFVVTQNAAIIGQLTISTIVLGSFRSCSAGYWIARTSAGQGIMPTALATAADHCFGALSLHRMEVNIRPENAASLAVVRKLRFREEGLRQRMLHIDGDWRDHLSFALTTEDLHGLSVRSRLG